MTKKQKEKVITALTDLKKLWRNGKAWLSGPYAEDSNGNATWDLKEAERFCVQAGLHKLKVSDKIFDKSFEAMNQTINPGATPDPFSYDFLTPVDNVTDFNDTFDQKWPTVRNMVTKTIKRLKKELATA